MCEFDAGDAGARVGYGFLRFGAGNGVFLGAGEDAGGVGLAAEMKRCAGGQSLDSRPIGT